MPTPPFYFTLHNFEHIKVNKLEWKSKSFYTHKMGYKMCINVQISKTQHVSVYIQLQRGEFDDQLSWPFSGKVTIALLNQYGNLWNHVKEIVVDDRYSSEFRQRVTLGQDAPIVIGPDDFISIPELDGVLNKKYLVYGDLHFAVTDVTLYT